MHNWSPWPVTSYSESATAFSPPGGTGASLPGGTGASLPGGTGASPPRC
jgi:hypothetical protein